MSGYEEAVGAVARWVKSGLLDRAIEYCEAQLKRLPQSDFHKALGRDWLEQSEATLRWLTKLHSDAAARFEPRALYCEMNRFDINTERWYLDGFAYEAVGNPAELSWLTGHQHTTTDGQALVLDGMDDLQQAYGRLQELNSVSPELEAASEMATVLLTLRMQELVQAAAQQAWEHGTIPDTVPILAAAHDAEPVFICATEAGKKLLNKAHRAALRAPPPACLRVDEATGPGVYLLHRWDKRGNSLHWDELWHDPDPLKRPFDSILQQTPLAAVWQAPELTLHRRKWRCDILLIDPFPGVWGVTQRAREVLEPLLAGSVEFLPVKCPLDQPVFAVHPLRHVPLAEDADVNVSNVVGGISSVRRYSFRVGDLTGANYFLIRQPPCSRDGKQGVAWEKTFVSDDFVQYLERNGLTGVMCQRVFQSSIGRP